MRPKGTAQELQRRRERAVLLLDENHGIRQVARMVGVAPGSVVRWRDAYEKKGLKALASKPHPGPTPKLSEKHRKKLVRLLQKGPPAHGYNTHLWTLKRVAELIYNYFGVRYDPSGVWHILNTLGWSCQKPERRARECNEAAIEQWRSKDWPHIKKRDKKRA